MGKRILLFAILILSLGFSASETSARDQVALKNFLIDPSHLPKTCQLEQAPGDNFFCPFGKNPLYSEKPDFVACLQRRIGMGAVKPAKAVLLQAFQDTQAQHKQELGIFAFEMQSIADLKAAQLMLANGDKETGLEIVTQGTFLFWIWNDVDKSSSCYQGIRQQLQKKGLVFSLPIPLLPEPVPVQRWGAWSLGLKTQ